MVEPAEELNSRDEVEAIRRIIRAVLAEEKEAARAEHGATGGLLDVIKTNWPGSEADFGRLVEAATSLPVVLAGGSRIDDEELLSRQEAAMRVGAVGCSVGRNIFMHERPEAITRALYRVIVDRWPAAQALEELTGAPV